MYIHFAPLPLPLRAHPREDLPALARSLDLILRNLMTLIAAYHRALGRWTLPVWARLSRANQRLISILTKLANGTYRPAAKRPGAAGRPPGKPRVRIPTGKSFLIRVVGYHCAGYASHLQQFLDHPDTIEALAKAPSAIRTLRPLCRILGVIIPKTLDPNPPTRRARIPKPKPPRLPPIRWGPPPGLYPDGSRYRPSIVHPKPLRKRRRL